MMLPKWLLRRLQAIADSTAAKRAPDYIIGGEADPYLRRWWLIRRNPVFNIYLHHFCRSDDDRALHDHPWLFNASIVLRGGYLEHLPKVGARGTDVRSDRQVVRIEGEVAWRWGRAPHRVQLWSDIQARPDGQWERGEPGEQAAWTIFITGPRLWSWGFYCPQGWRHWREFTAGKNGELVGKGCD